MNTKVLLAALAGGVAAFLLGWLVYGILLADTMKSLSVLVEGAEKNPPELWAIAVSNILWALFYAMVFTRWAGISTLKAGAMAGLWMSALIALSFDLGLFAMYNMWTMGGVVLDVVVSSVMGAVVGGVVGWVLGTGKG